MHKRFFKTLHLSLNLLCFLNDSSVTLLSMQQADGMYDTQAVTGYGQTLPLSPETAHISTVGTQQRTPTPPNGAQAHCIEMWLRYHLDLTWIRTGGVLAALLARDRS